MTINKIAARTSFLAALSLFAVSASHAQAFTTLYSFTSLAGNQATSSVTSGAPTNATASVISRGSGLTAAAAGNSMSSSGWSTTTIDLNDYYEVTVTPSAGYALNMNQLRFNLRISGTGPTVAEIRSNMDSFGASIGSTITPSSATAGIDVAQSLSGAAFQGVTSALTFRIYGYTSGGAGGTMRLQNGTIGGLEVSGFAAQTPEAFFGCASGPDDASGCRASSPTPQVIDIVGREYSLAERSARLCFRREPKAL